ncbi:MAG: sugar phosphate isomerase/epimerase family protein [Phycisphaerales bacterium JB063]
MQEPQAAQDTARQDDAGASKGSAFSRRAFMATGLAAGAAALPAVMSSGPAMAEAQDVVPGRAVTPPEGKRLLLSCKLSMVTKELAGRPLTLANRLSLAGEAGFDGVDLDEAGSFTPAEARLAVAESGVFVHNAINHAHWQQRFTSANQAERQAALDNLMHCIRVSHAAGGSAVLLVPGAGGDGSETETVERSVEWISKALPLAASLGQRILFENVWNRMFYEHDQGPEQSADRWAAYVDAFNSPWVGMYHDLGNHWKYGNPADWVRTFGHRAVKFDVKGYSRANNNWAEIGEGDLPWGEVRQALDEVNFHGWLTAEVGGGGLARLITVREQMERVFAIG